MRNTFALLSIHSYNVPTEVLEEPVKDAYVADVTEFQKPFESLSSSEIYTKKFDSRLRTILSLEDNWDGENAVAIDPQIIDHTESLLENLNDFNLNKIDEESILPTPYGTIIIEVTQSNTDIIIEIGSEEISYYVENSSQHSYTEDSFSTNDIFPENFVGLNEALQSLN